MSYFPLAEIVVVLVIFGILFLLSRIKVTVAGAPETNPKAETNKVAEEGIDDPDDTIEPTKPATFFPDKPSPRDYLDFKSYAEPLAELISQEATQTPLTVGLFGAWGSGKTTLMRMIERSLRRIQKQPNSMKFVLVSFEAWKYYKEDALWRAMLLRVLDALRPDPQDESKQALHQEIERLEQSLYRDVEWEEKGGLTIDWPKLARAGAGGALKLSFSLVPGMATIMEAVKVVDSSLAEGDISKQIDTVSSAFQRNMVTHHQSQLSSIEQFQTEFSKLVRNHFDGKRLVIFVDDLDRCLPEKAIEVLEAIKLFLDVEGCVFILGIDQEVITRGLKAKYKEVGFLEDGESQAFSVHYIEKLIQLPFHLPPIESREMQSYINDLNVAWPDPKCAQIFAEGLSPNPRQIKRTINVYMLLVRLAKERQDNLKAVTPLRLAKVVILQTAYPDVFDRLKSNADLLKDLEKFCTDSSSLTDEFLIEAVKQPKLKMLFQLLADEELASFASLKPHELTSFFSLARKAPLVSEVVVREAAPPAPVATVEPASGTASRPADRPFQVRAPVRDFVGRVTQLERMTTALRSETSIGVITGMPGTGKTEFALLVAERLRPDYPDGHLFVDMRGDEKPITAAEALSACLRAFGNPADLSLENELVAAYRSQLNGKRVLVLLDNAANAMQVTPLIPPQGSAILITSRNSLIIPGMTSIPLDQLSSEDALTLFKRISSRVPENIAAEICKLCGYLPLAIRAAASMLEVTADLDPEVYRDQLRDEQKRLELLRTDDSTGTLAKSLEASFNLSYSRLSDTTAPVFRKLAVFPETFDAKAEEVICEDPDHVSLSDLLKFGLTFYDTEAGRYRVHPLLRLFAQRHLEEAESQSIARSHAKYYLLVAREADAQYSTGGDALIKGLKTYDREQANIETGFTWSRSQAPSDEEAASICSDYPRYCSQFLSLRKSPRERIAWFTPALEAARRIHSANSIMSHLIDLGSAHSSLGETQKAIDFYTEALGIAGPVNASQIELLIHRNLGLLYRDMGNANEAMSHFEQQLELSRRLRDARRESEALVNLANLLLVIGRTDDAIENLDRAVVISREISDLPGEAMALGNLGRAYNYLGDTNRALEFHRQQLEISQNKLGDRFGEAAVRFNIALSLKQTGELKEAREQAGVALKIFDELESPNASRVQEWLAKLPAEQ